MSRSTEQRFDDIRAAVERCMAYRPFLDSAELSAMAYDAVLRNLAVIGEAVRALPADAKAAHDLPWPAIAGLRNIVIHEYFRVQPELIRDIVDTHLTQLLSALSRD